MINEHPLWKTTVNGGWREGCDNIAAYVTRRKKDLRVNRRARGIRENNEK
jgi:hypothetical protein